MKKVVSLLMVLFLICGLLCSCGANTEEKDKAATKSIESALEKFDYVKAQEVLDSNPNMTKRKSYLEQVKYESFLLECCKSLQLSLFDPNSLLIREVEFYSEFGSHYSGDYPYVVFRYSAKNKMGGYADSEKIAFGPYNYNYNESFEPYGYENATSLYSISNINRINKMISDGIMPNINIEVYKNEE